jgi:glycogen synthase
MTDGIAFIAYETPHAPCGGIAAVIGRLTRQMQKASGLPTVVITPFHHQIEKTTALLTQMSSVGWINDVSFDGKNLAIEILRFDGEWTCYFLRPEDKRFFAGHPNPYLVGSTPDEISENLLRDSLLFGACVAESLEIIDPAKHWTLMMQDWEAATTALAVSKRSNRPKMFLTLHNSYDSRATDSDLQRAGIAPEPCPAYRPGPHQMPVETVLARALRIVHSPVFTVSEQFAIDFTEDKLQTEVMAHHLQGLLKGRLLGVNNGLFSDLSLDKETLQKARRGDIENLKQWKVDNRKKALEALRAFHPSVDKPLWGDLKKFDPADDTVCWFVMAGRDDTRQKGYDVAAAAVEAFLNCDGTARFFFFPVPGDEGLSGLGFLKSLAESFPEKVLVLPFIWKEGYIATLQGASYGIMPSLYEPFGMANEFYLMGTVGVGRATGGILQQVVPLWADASFSYAAQKRALRWHPESAHATGILFRERDGIESERADWQGINAAQYNNRGPSQNRVEQRRQFVLFDSMAYELSLAIAGGVRIYEERRSLYYRMLVQGIDFIRNTFSWERAAQEYYRNVR